LAECQECGKGQVKAKRLKGKVRALASGLKGRKMIKLTQQNSSLNPKQAFRFIFYLSPFLLTRQHLLAATTAPDGLAALVGCSRFTLHLNLL
jgi:hypothetical protein